MTVVVTENCIRCKYTDCADVCPVDDCFREGPNFLVVDPDRCIDCNVCIPECPAEAIKNDYDLSPDEQKYLDLNARLAAKWPGINTKKPELEDAKTWDGVTDKLQFLQE